MQLEHLAIARRILRCLNPSDAVLAIEDLDANIDHLNRVITRAATRRAELRIERARIVANNAQQLAERGFA